MMLVTIRTVRWWSMIGVALGTFALALICVDARAATLSLSFDPLLHPEARLTATPGLTSAFGGSVAVSRDGGTAVIGGETDNGGAGAVWVFMRAGSTWVQQGPKLTPSDPLPHAPFGVRFGAKVAISADGGTVLVGCRDGPLAGWVFVRSGGVWREQGRRLMSRNRGAQDPLQAAIALSADGSTAVLSGTYTALGSARDAAWIFMRSGAGFRQQGPGLSGRGESTSGFGYAAALSGDGGTLLLGAPGGSSGAAWIFRRSHGRWKQQGPRLPKSGNREEFGASVALSANGRTALIGIPAENARERAVFVYTRTHGAWAKSSVLLAPSKAPSRYFGSFVALSGDGKLALVAAPPGTGTGAEYIFSHIGRRWRQTAKLTSATGLGDTVALSGDGDTVIAPPNGNNPASTAYVYARSGTQWSEQAPKIMPSDESGRDNPGFGRSVAVSADGRTALVGEYGAAWVFVRSGGSWTQQGPQLSAQTGDGRFGLSVALSDSGDTAVVGDPGESGSSGTVYVFSRSGGAWTQEGSGLRPSDASAPSRESHGVEEGFGIAVAISADASTVLVGDPGEAGNVGAAWAFAHTGTTWAQQGPKLTGGRELGAGSFGYSVALSSDGNTALIGAPYDDNQSTTSASVRQNTSGAAWTFARSAGTWSQRGAKLTVTNGEYQTDLGLAVALSANGQTALIGASESAWAFAANSTGWSQQGPALSAGTPFGQRLSLSADGNTALIGGIPSNGCGKYMNDTCDTSGSAWTYTRTGSTWTHQHTLTGRRQLGSGVAISADGATALIGSPLEGSSINSIEGGTVLVSALPPPAAG